MRAAVPEDQAAAAGFVLAGGRSSRMGRDKARIEVAGKPLIGRAVDLLREAGLDAFIAGARSDLSAYAPVIEDQVSDQGPLGGICAALAANAAAWAVLLPVDLPLLPASLISLLLDHARITGCAVTVASVNGFVQTFPVVLASGALPLLQAELESGRRSCIAAFRSIAPAGGMSVLPVELLAQAGQVDDPGALPPAFWFLNVNTRDDLELVDRCMRHLIA